jgi:hypothetical protein
MSFASPDEETGRASLDRTAEGGCPHMSFYSTVFTSTSTLLLLSLSSDGHDVGAVANEAVVADVERDMGVYLIDRGCQPCCRTALVVHN